MILIPALTVGGGEKVTVMVSRTLEQFPLLDVLRKIKIVPTEISAALGIYVPFNAFGFGENDPVPLDDQVPVPVLDDPLNNTFGLLTQTETLLPAFTSGAGVIVMTIESETAKQVPLPVLVRYSVTVPAEVSAALGV